MALVAFEFVEQTGEGRLRSQRFPQLLVARSPFPASRLPAAVFAVSLCGDWRSLKTMRFPAERLLGPVPLRSFLTGDMAPRSLYAF